MESPGPATVDFDNFVVLGHARTENGYNLVKLLIIVKMNVIRTADLAGDIIEEAGRNKTE